MFRPLLALTIGAGLLLATPAAASPVTAAAQSGGYGQPDKVVTAYFADWDVYGRQYFVKDIPVDKLNVIQYAFGKPTFDTATETPGCEVVDPWADYQMVYWGGENTVDGVADTYLGQNGLYGNYNQLRKLKLQHPDVKIEISLGGWTKSTWFAEVSKTAARREAFVKACIDTFIRGNLPTGGWPEDSGGVGIAEGIFDGIDLDWEYPTAVAGGNVNVGPEDRHNATLLAREFRSQLDTIGAEKGKHYLLTAALPAAKSSTKYYELANFVKSLDWANVMTYDFNVPGGATAAPDTLFTRDSRDANASDWTWNTVGTVGYYLTQGVPASKIVVGVPFYGNQYIRSDAGLYGPFDNTGLDGESLAWDQKPQPSRPDRRRGDPDAGRRRAGRVHPQLELAGGGAVALQPLGRTRSRWQTADAADHGGHHDRLYGSGVDRRAHGADPAAQPAWRDGLGAQPGLQRPRPDQPVRPAAELARRRRG
jgi:chitinase